jgi:4-diphosphocytidyl-2-C-methyl-D-erythritol kinase
MFAARPPAKVNLTLEVGPLGDDGYHPLRSVFLRIGLTDRLTIEPGSGDVDRLTVTGLTGTPIEGNLVLEALNAIRTHAGVNLPPLDVTLEKRIPAAAGLGGGSSDAASALELAQVAWGIRVARDAELDLAASIGSDVPFFYFGMLVAAIRGRGEEVQWLPGINGGLAMLLVTPAVPLQTASVFRRYDDLKPGGEADQESITDLLEGDVFADEPTTEELLDWADGLRNANDLWPAAVALEPVLLTLRNLLEGRTSRPWSMTGSGPTLFALYPSVDHAADAGRQLVRDHAVAIEGCIVHAVDLVGPDPDWRYP